jgi:hypothetical protein
MTKNEIGQREYDELKLYAKDSLFADLKNIEKQIEVYNG